MKTKTTENTSADSEKIVIRHRSALPQWTCAAVWVVAALFCPMYRVSHYIIIALVSIAAAVAALIFDPGWNEYADRPKPTTGNPEVDAINSEIDRVTKYLSQASAALPIDKAAQSARLDSIRLTLRSVTEDLKEDPNDAKSCKKLLNYYLPLTVKLVEKYAFLLKQKSGTSDSPADSPETLNMVITRVEEAFTQIDAALKKQLDALYSNDELDISTDIDVMNELLRRSGIE